MNHFSRYHYTSGESLEHKYLDCPQNFALADVISIRLGVYLVNTSPLVSATATLSSHAFSSPHVLERRGGKLGSLCKALGHYNNIFFPETEPEDLLFYLRFSNSIVRNFQDDSISNLNSCSHNSSFCSTTLIAFVSAGFAKVAIEALACTSHLGI